MAVISELIRVEDNGSLSFGDYTRNEKAKLENVMYRGGSYKVKTCKDITKLECDDIFVYESVPGTAVHGFVKDKTIVFSVEGAEDAQITLELEAGTEYAIVINGEAAGDFKTNLGGKLSFGVAFGNEETVAVEIIKK